MKYVTTETIDGNTTVTMPKELCDQMCRMIDLTHAIAETARRTDCLLPQSMCAAIMEFENCVKCDPWLSLSTFEWRQGCIREFRRQDFR